MVLLFSEAYSAGGKILEYQTVAFGSMALFDILAHALMAAGALWKSAAIVVVLIPVVIGLSWYLIGEMSGVGAAMALAIAMCAATAIGAVLTIRQFGTLVRPATAIRVIVATSIIAYASTVISAAGLLLVVKLGALLVVYLIILALLGEITRRDLKPFAVWSK
jgi:O-antigen/teichoic acid export membrane protein